MADRVHLTIGEVLSLLREEFPDVSISKIRFLESQGLVEPERTPSGYRKFYDHDVDRLRWILRQQREHFLPLKVIRGRLTGQEGELSDAEAGGDRGPDPSGPLTLALDDLGAGAPAPPPSGAPGPHDVPGPPPAGQVAEPASGSVGENVPAGEGAPAGEGTSGDAADNGHLQPSAGDNGTAPGAPDPLAPTPEAVTAAPGSSAADISAADITAPSPEGPSGPGLDDDAPGGVEGDGAADAPDAATASSKPRGSRHAAPKSPRDTAGPPAAEGAPGRPAPPPEAGNGPPDVYTVAELAEAVGCTPQLIRDLQQYGIIVAGANVGGKLYFDAEAVRVARAGARFAELGVEPRHLRPWRNAVDREASLFEQLVMPLMRQRNPQSRRQAAERLEELSTLGGELRAGLLAEAVRSIK